MPLITPSQTEGTDVPNRAGSTESVTPSEPGPESIRTLAAQQAAHADLAPAIADQIPIGGAVSTRPWWRRRRFLISVVLVAAVGGAAVAATSLLGGDSEAASEAGGSATEIRAVEAITGDLSEFVTVDGVLAYGDAVVFRSTVDGTVTDIVDTDDVLARGDVAYEVDGSPVVVFWGGSPLYRPLELGVSDGADVRVLESNLAAFGFTAEGELVVNNVFDAATTAAIEEFQADVAMVVTGTLTPAAVLVLEGPAFVSDVLVSSGTVVRATNPMLSLQVTDVATSAVMPVDDGLLTDLPRLGEQFSTGDVAFEYDTEPVIVIVGDVALDRLLAVDVEDGEDIEFLEQTLLDLGFDADGDLEVDEHFDEATEQALSDWEESLDLEVDGIFDPADFVVLPEDHNVIDVAVERGDRVDTGAVVFTTGVSTQTLVATLDESDADLISVGDVVDVEFADETIAGTIVDIDSPVASPADPDSETVAFEIVLDGPAPETDAKSTDVEVQIVERIATEVTLVPASALVSLGDGSYAVEEVRGNATVFVSVVPGDFADGMVEVEGIEPGTVVVVPS